MFQPRKKRIKENRKQMLKKRLLTASIVIVVMSVVVKTMYFTDEAAHATYTVQQNDTLYGLSKKFNSSIDEIKSANGLQSDKVVSGQKLTIPQPAFHTVKQGETVYSISKLYQIPAETLVQANGIQNHKIYAGQKLYFTNQDTYIVRTNDTLHSIAKHHKLTVDQLKQYNGLKSNTIYIGQKLNLTSEIEEAEMGIIDYYTVVSGDTLWNISQRFAIPFTALKQANRLVEDKVVVGQKLFIPGEKRYETAEIVGAADNNKIEFLVQGHPVPLRVTPGNSNAYQKKVGQKVFIAYKNGALISAH